MRQQVFIAAVFVGLLTVAGCSATGEQATDVATPNQASPAPQNIDASWYRFGVVMAVHPIQLQNAEGQPEAGMQLDIVLDNGDSMVVEQRVAQAGELHVGDRVRLLQIGAYSRVTFWPYQKNAQQPAQ